VNPPIATNIQRFAVWPSLCPAIGTMTRTHTVTLVIIAVFFVVTSVIEAESLADYPDRHPPVRTTDARLATLMRDGVRFSSTFQTLADRLAASDLIVYVELDSFAPEGLDGRLTFVTSTPGARYVLIRVAYYPDAARQLAIIGHELQHAVEIANAPAVVDEQSLGREYGRIGYSHPGFMPHQRMYDTQAAIKAGHRVYREFTTGSSD
jgi:hypothetical protein